MPIFQRHVFVCVNERPDSHPRGCCSAKQSKEIRASLKAAIHNHGLQGMVRVNNAGCLDQCEHGPTLVVYPEQVWYGFVTPEDVNEIVESHLVNEHPVERLRLPDGCVNTSACPHRGGSTVQLGGLAR